VATVYGALADDDGNNKLSNGSNNPTYDPNQDWQMNGILSNYNSKNKVNAAVYGNTVKRSFPTTLTYSANMGPNDGLGTDWQALWAGYFAGNVYIGDKLSQTVSSVSEKLTIDGNVKINGNLQVTGTVSGGGSSSLGSIYTKDCGSGGVGVKDCSCNSTAHKVISGGAYCWYNGRLRESRWVNNYTWRVACEGDSVGGMWVTCMQ